MSKNELKQYKRQEIEDIKNWLKSLDNKMSNHLVHLEADVAQMKVELAWLKKFFWLVTGPVITALVGALMLLIIK